MSLPLSFARGEVRRGEGRGTAIPAPPERAFNKASCAAKSTPAFAGCSRRCARLFEGRPFGFASLVSARSPPLLYPLSCVKLRDRVSLRGGEVRASERLERERIPQLNPVICLHLNGTPHVFSLVSLLARNASHLRVPAPAIVAGYTRR